MFSSINTCWVLVAAFLVYFMQAGFALCEAGFTRAKNTGNILMKNMMDFCYGTPCYWVIGFGLMFGGTSALIGGVDPFIQGDYSHLGLDIPLWVYIVFQTVFCATAATIVSGFSTIPAPPPKGESSTVRCTSCVKSRGLMQLTSIRPLEAARCRILWLAACSICSGNKVTNKNFILPQPIQAALRQCAFLPD